MQEKLLFALIFFFFFLHFQNRFYPLCGGLRRKTTEREPKENSILIYGVIKESLKDAVPMFPSAKEGSVLDIYKNILGYDWKYYILSKNGE